MSGKFVIITLSMPTSLYSQPSWKAPCHAHTSTGQKKRLSIAQALIFRPKLLLLDQPAAGLSTTGIQWLKELLQKLRNKNITMIITGDAISEINETVERMIFLKSGTIVEDALTEEIKEKMKPGDFFRRIIDKK